MDFLKEEDVDVMQWPGQSPDMNIIEHVWDHMAREIKDDVFKNCDELFAKLQEVWNNIDIDYIHKLYNSMTERVADLRKARGGATRFWVQFDHCQA